MENDLKRSVYTLLEPDDNAGFWDRVMDISMTILILLNVLFVILETIEYFQNKFNHFFFIFEVVSILIFSTDYILRVWSCISLEKYRHPFFTCPAVDQLQKEQRKQQLFILHECCRNKHCRAKRCFG
jgi:voltage-gated potassium channel